MKRPRRHKFTSAGIFFLVYSILHVYSQQTNVTSPIPEELKSSSPASLTSIDKIDSTVESPRGNVTSSTESVPEENESSTYSPSAAPTLPSSNAHPTWRPRRENCTAPAIEQFPRPLMGPYARKHGGLVIHVLVAVFTFLGLAIVCDDYFVSSLDRICEELKLSPDVAGATFMAAGSSAPELATVIIGVFFAKDDIGVSGVIGSAVFNIMFVISVCALCSGTVSYLNWWPLCRDCFFYAISILIMLFTISNEVISWPESLIMLLMYVVYCIALHFNSQLERWALSLKLPIKLPTKEEQASLVTYKSAVVPESKANVNKVENGRTTENPVVGENVAMNQLSPVGYNTNVGYDNEGYYNTDQWNPNTAWSEDSSQPQAAQLPVWDPNSMWDQSGQPPQSAPSQVDQGKVQPGSQTPVQQAQLTIQAAGIPNQSYYKPRENKVDGAVDPLVKPVDAGIFRLTSWYIVFPIHYMCRLTMPDCKSEKYRNWYPFTFLVSMIWISFYSYFMVWMITVIGNVLVPNINKNRSTLGIPDTVMGLTFVAAGVSVPDALSSIAVIKEGYGDMAVSNAVGSNVFDILICLGLPWFIQTAIIKPGSHVNVISKGLTYSTLSLLSTVVFLVLATHLNGWKLDRKYGVILMVWYLIFITFASLYELNVFGQLNPPECFSVF
ncbi:putative sodium/potassium/calcium exchanger CG1090 [Arctopsyche grandis]|uniref:putative sodium/potassium/calcium exchanger CG1090 n=1 Tax=Arctopsyche grandis TaxID=121162 RepID=UPI00406D7151